MLNPDENIRWSILLKYKHRKSDFIHYLLFIIIHYLLLESIHYLLFIIYLLSLRLIVNKKLKL